MSEVPLPSTTVGLPSLSTESFVSISAAADGSVWAVDSAGQLLQYQTSSEPWTAADHAFADVSAASDGTVWGVDSSGHIYSYTGSGTWTGLPSPSTTTLVALAVGSASFIWGMDGSGMVYQFQAQTKSWAGVAAVPSGARLISATSDGTLWALNRVNTVYQYVSEAWIQISPVPEPMADISAGAAGWVWGIGTSGRIWQYDGNGNPWEPITEPDETPVRIRCGDDTTVIILAQSGNLVRFNLNAEIWQSLPGPSSASLVQISVGNVAIIWGLDAQGNAYEYTGATGNWEPVQTTLRFVQVAAGSASDLWGLDAQGNVYRSQGPATQWSQIAGNLGWVAAAADGTAWGRNHQSQVYYFSNGSWQLDDGAPAMAQVSVASSTEIVGVNASGAVYECSGPQSAWQPILVGTTGGLTNVSVLPGGALLGVNGSDNVFLYLGDWTQIGGTLKQISAGSLSNIWGLAPDGTPVNLTPSVVIMPHSPMMQIPVPAGALPGWDTEDPFNEARSTHLWIVNRAAELTQKQGSTGQQIYSLVKPGQGRIGDPFHDNLCQGLYDADFKSAYNNPVLRVTTYMSHFYDPDTGKNWLNFTSPTALTQGRAYFLAAVMSYIGNDLATAGYNLGLSLHYFTDMTQPMHAANFTYLSSGPILGYHTDFEGYIMEVQSSVSPPNTYTPGPFGPDPDEYIIATAANSKHTYFRTICPDLVYDGYFGFDWPAFVQWRAIAESVKAPVLQAAITATAQYLVAWQLLVDRTLGLPGYAGPCGGYGGSFVPKPPVPATVPAGATITGFAIWPGSLINAFQISYTHGTTGGTIAIAGSDLSPKPVSVTFAPGEYITGVSGRYGSSIDSLAISTNKKSYGPYGGSGGNTEFSLLIPPGLQLAGLFGRAGSYLDAIGLIASEGTVTSSPTPLWVLGPSGGNGGQNQQSSAMPDGAQVTSLTIWAGNYVNSLEVAYTYLGSNGVLQWQGGSDRSPKPVTIAFAQGEYIMGVSGRYGRYVDSLIITTNLNTYGPYGGTSGSVVYSYEVWPGSTFAGFWGQTGSYIDALGILLRTPTPEAAG